MPPMRTRIKELIVGSGIPPSRHMDYVNAMLEFGKWRKAQRCDVNLPHRYDLYSYVNEHVLKGSAIAYLEFGVFKGETIKKWAKLNSDPDSRFWGFDSFEGLPNDWPVLARVVPKGTFDTNGVTPEIDDDRVSFVKGWFQKSLPTFLKEFQCSQRLVVHLDADLHSSTLYVLTRLHQHLVPGTILIFDEFNAVNGEFRAFVEYVSAYMIDYKVLCSSGDVFNQAAIEITGRME